MILSKPPCLLGNSDNSAEGLSSALPQRNVESDHRCVPWRCCEISKKTTKCEFLMLEFAGTRPGKHTIENGPVEIVDFPIIRMVIFHSFLYTFTGPGNFIELTPCCLVTVWSFPKSRGIPPSSPLLSSNTFLRSITMIWWSHGLESSLKNGKITGGSNSTFGTLKRNGFSDRNIFRNILDMIVVSRG